MAALKEIKARIASVNNTLKITSAMKMVASAKLHRVQSAAAALAEYDKRLRGIAAALGGAAAKKVSSPWLVPHEKRDHAVVIVFSSDGSLCGGFNNNVIRALQHGVEELLRDGYAAVTVYPIGEKVAQATVKAGFQVCDDFRTLASEAQYGRCAELADRMMAEYREGKVDSVMLLYNHFFSMGRQAPEQSRFLPMELPQAAAAEAAPDFIYEPGAAELMTQLLPYTLRTRLYEVLLDSSVAEHAARMIAMQTATDNATELLDELRLTYNKRRQQAITDELADITQAAE